MAIEGPLEELNLQDVLQLLEMSHKTGILTVRADGPNDEAVIHFDDGVIIFAARRRSTRRIGQLLLRAGKLTERELDRGLELQRGEPGRRLAEILLEMGSVQEQDLVQSLHFQMEETIHEIIPWKKGYFRFEERATRQYRVMAHIHVESILMEGARRIDEWARLESKVPSGESVPVLAQPGMDAFGGQPLELKPEEWEVLAEVDGERDIRQISAGVGQTTFEVAKIVYGLVGLGIVQVHERRARIPERELHAAMQEVEALLDAGKPEEAARRVTELEAAHADRAELAMLAGRALAAQRRPRAAVEAFARAAGLDPLSEDAHYRLGFAAVRTGELERALEAWRAFLRLAGDGVRRAAVTRALSAAQTLNELLPEESK